MQLQEKKTYQQRFRPSRQRPGPNRTDLNRPTSGRRKTDCWLTFDFKRKTIGSGYRTNNGKTPVLGNGRPIANKDTMCSPGVGSSGSLERRRTRDEESPDLCRELSVCLSPFVCPFCSIALSFRSQLKIFLLQAASRSYGLIF